MKQKLKFQDILLEEKKRHYADLVQSCARKSRQFNLEDFVLGYTENCRQYIEAQNLLNLSLVNGSGSYELQPKPILDIRYHSSLTYARSLYSQSLKTKAFIALKRHPKTKLKNTLHPQFCKNILRSYFRKLKRNRDTRLKKDQLRLKEKEYNQKWRVLSKCFQHWKQAYNFLEGRAQLLVVLLTKWEMKHLSSSFNALQRAQHEPVRLSKALRLEKTKGFQSLGSSLYDSKLGEHKFSIISTQVSTLAHTPRIETVASSLELPFNQLSSLMLIDQDMQTPELKPQKQRTFTFSEPHQSYQFNSPFEDDCIVINSPDEKTAFLPEAYLSRSSEDRELPSFSSSSHCSQSLPLSPLSYLSSQQNYRPIQQFVREVVGMKNNKKGSSFRRIEDNSRQQLTMVQLLRRVETNLLESLEKEREAQERLRQERLRALK